MSWSWGSVIRATLTPAEIKAQAGRRGQVQYYPIIDGGVAINAWMASHYPDAPSSVSSPRVSLTPRANPMRSAVGADRWYDEGVTVRDDHHRHAVWQANRIARSLGLTSSVEVVWFEPSAPGTQGDQQGDRDLMGYFSPRKSNTIHLNAARLGSKAWAVHIIGHEVYHVYQHDIGTTYREDDAEEFAFRACRDFGLPAECPDCRRG